MCVSFVVGFMVCFQIQKKSRAQRNTLEVCMTPFAASSWLKDSLGPFSKWFSKELGKEVSVECRQLYQHSILHQNANRLTCYIFYGVTSLTATGCIKLTVCLLQIKKDTVKWDFIRLHASQEFRFCYCFWCAGVSPS